jgi:hypothetical protein
MRNTEEYERRRRELHLKMARQRQELAMALEPVNRLAAMVDRAAAGTRWIRSRPELVLGAAAAVGVLGVYMLVRRPTRAVRLARLGVTAWNAWRWARVVLPLGAAFRRRW